MLLSDYDIPGLDIKGKEDRIIINKTLPKIKYEKCIKTLNVDNMLNTHLVLNCAKLMLI